jgi:hypothetical protein
MSSTTLAQFRDRAREIADYQNSLFVTDTELNKIINEGAKELYDWIVERYEDYYMADPVETTITSPAGVIDLTVVLPNFYKLRGIDYKIDNTNWENMRRFNWKERNRFTYNTTTLARRGGVVRVYRIVGNNIRVLPESSANGTYRLWHIPLQPELSDDGDSVEGYDGWEKYVSLYAAKFIKMKAEESVQDINAEMGIIKERIERLGSNRDLEGVATVSEIEGRQDLYGDNEGFY